MVKKLRRKNDEWTKNWTASMKWYGDQMHDVSTGENQQKSESSRENTEKFRKIARDITSNNHIQHG